MARELVGDAKPSWQMDIDDLEHQKKHFQKELNEMLESDDISIATDEDEHEKLREKMREIDAKIEKIRAENENKPNNGGAEAQNEGSGQEVPDEDPVQVEEVPFEALEAQANWRKWKRELPKDKYFYAKGFVRQLGGNGALAHEAETVTEEVLAQTDIAHKTMQATRKYCSEDSYEKAKQELAKCEAAWQNASDQLATVKKLATDLGVPDILKLLSGKETLLYPPADKLEYNHEDWLRQEQARKALAAAEAAEKALAASASKVASLLTQEMSQ